MKLFWQYLKTKCDILILFSVFAIAFLLTGYLCVLDIKVTLYMVFLCFIVTGLILIVNYLKFVKKHRNLMYIEKEISYTIENLPETFNTIETDYCNIIKALNEDRVNMQTRLSHQYSNLVEYYTIWAHQIKTPISAIKLILEAGENSEIRELKEELQKIEQYVEMALCYLKLEEGINDYLIKEYELDDIIKQAVKKYASLFIRKKIKLEYVETGYKVVTDEKWLLLVIEQLLSNALKYTKKGSIVIDMEEEGILCIKDTGIGIEETDIPRVFDKGFTGVNGRKDKKATGIGLYLCKRVLKELEHGISIDSNVGQGTSVKINLKREKIGIE